MNATEKKALRDRLAARTKAEMDARWADPAFRAEHAAWENEYKVAVAMHKAREQAGLTQLDLAERMNTRRSNVSRIENGQNVTFATFARFLHGCGFDFKVSIFPARNGTPTGDFHVQRVRSAKRTPTLA